MIQINPSKLDVDIKLLQNETGFDGLSVNGLMTPLQSSAHAEEHPHWWRTNVGHRDLCGTHGGRDAGIPTSLAI